MTNQNQPKELNILNILKIKTYKNVCNFDIYQNQLVNGLLVVDDNYLYVLVDDKLIDKYQLKDIKQLVLESTVNGGYVLLNGEKVLVCYTNKYQEEMIELTNLINQNNLKYSKNNNNQKEQAIKNFISYLFNYKLLFGLIFVLSIAIILLSIYRPQVLKQIIDEYLIIKSFSDGFAKLIIVFGLVYVSTNILGLFKSLLNTKMFYNLEHDLRFKVYSKVEKLPLSSINNKNTGDLLTYLSYDIEVISRFLVHNFVDSILAIIELSILLVIMFIENYLLTIFIIVLVPIIILILAKTRQAIRKKGNIRWKYYSLSNDNLCQTLEGIKVVKTYSSEEKEINKFKFYNQKLMSSSINVELLFARLRPLIAFLFATVQILVYYFVSNKIINNEMSVGSLLKWIAYYHIIISCFETLLIAFQAYSYLQISANKISSILNEDETDNQNKNQVMDLKGNIIFDHISFSYNKKDFVLKDVSFEINQGEKIGIVGFSGSGKTTLVNLLMKLYKVDSGTIYVDNQDINTYDEKTYRQKIGFVMQECQLFKGTIIDNLTYGNENVSFEELLDVCQKTKVHDFVINKEFAYQTMLENKGEGLSVGQKQRIAIARAMLLNPSIYIFDEATSSLDTITENQVQDSINEVSKNKTTIIIAHRLSTLAKVDRLLVFDNGRLVEQGSHEKLLAKKGYYYSLVQAQQLNYEKSKY